MYVSLSSGVAHADKSNKKGLSDAYRGLTSLGVEFHKPLILIAALVEPTHLNPGIHKHADISDKVLVPGTKGFSDSLMENS